MHVDVSIRGLEGVGRIGELAEGAVGAGQSELVRVGEDVMADSKENHVPVRDGVLRASGYVKHEQQGDRFNVIVGFGGPAAPYAAIVHENPRAGQTGGVSPSGRRYTRWAQVGHFKFLELPALAIVSSLGARLTAAMRGAIR